MEGLIWSYEDKIVEMMNKLKNIVILAYLICLYFNAYLVKTVFFSCKITYLTEEQNR